MSFYTISLTGTRSSVDRAAVSGAALSGVRILSGAELFLTNKIKKGRGLCVKIALRNLLKSTIDIL